MKTKKRTAAGTGSPEPAISLRNNHRVRRNIWKNRAVYLMILPVVVFYIIFRYIPMGWLSISFYDYKILKGFGGSKFVGFDNFVYLFSNSSFWQALLNTLLLNLLVLLICFPAPIIFALLLNELTHRKMKKAIQTVSYLPYFLSAVVVVGMIYNFLSSTSGSINLLRQSMGMNTINFLQEPQYFRPIYVVANLWQGIGWSSIIYLAALSSVDDTLYEAAMVDGASRFQRCIHVTIPSILGTIMIMLIFQIGSLITVGFDMTYLLQTPTNLSVSEVLTTYTYKLGMTSSRFGLATVVDLFNSVVSFALVMLANVFSKKVAEVSIV